MRHRVFGGLVLATTAVLLVPGAASAQLDYDSGIPGRPAIVAPIPTGNPGGNGFYAWSGFTLLTQTFALGSQTIAFRGLIDSTGVVTGLPGTYIGSGVAALASDEFGRRSFHPGWTAGLGYKFDNGVSVYGGFQQQLDQKYTAGATLVAPFFRSRADLADTFLVAPVYNFAPDYAGPAIKTAYDLSAVSGGGNFYGIWNGAGTMTIDFTQRFTSGELGARVPLLQTEYSRVYGLAGARYGWFFEKFHWRTVSFDIQGRALPEYAADYTNTLSQRMYGPFVGCGHEVYLGKRFGVSLDLTGSPMVNVVKERAYYELGDETTKTKRSRNDFTIVPNANADLNLMWYPIEGVQVKLGYQANTYYNTLFMKEPVSFNVGAIDPEYATRAFRIVHGFTVGLGFFF